MTTESNIILQYSAVALIFLCVLIWLIVRLINSKKGNKSSGCCGCALSSKCEEIKQKKKEEKCSSHTPR